ncbi:MAG: PSD1 and planctomycete cytochrome C domain-containing protein [Planctomycetota bacterium]
MRAPSLALALAPIVSIGLLRIEPVPPSCGLDPDWSEVRAILERRCLECHGGERVRSEFRLSTGETFRQGGARGEVVREDQLGRSRLLEVVGYQNPDLAMPPDGQLPDEEVRVLRNWVLSGAEWPEGEEGRLADPERFPREAGADPGAQLDWWAYRPLLDPEVPPIFGEFGEHPVDAFLEARRLERDTEASGPATPLALLRRATFDLTGLPPSPEEQRAFEASIEADGLDAAFDGVLGRLLASPQYGEHQARRWLDLVRYADSNGYERDNPKENIWRYRDYVVRSYQEDKPFDLFGIEQLAGDEFAHYAADLLRNRSDPDPLLATGYYRLTIWDDEPADRPQSRADELADIVDTTGQVFLGTTVGCARCHDHKADPFSQRDYYSMTAMFNNVVSFAGPAYSGRGRGGRVRDVADRPAPGQITSLERDAGIDRLNAELDRVIELNQLGEELESLATQSTLVPDARELAHAWAFDVASEVPDGWFQPGFDDSAWSRGPAGFGRRGTPGAVVGTEWRSRQIRLRTTFRLTEVPDLLHLTLHHDEDVRVYLNGIEVFEKQGYATDYFSVALPETAVDALVVGRNVLAVSCAQSAGGQFVDLGLHVGAPEDPGADPLSAWRELLIARASDVLGPEEAERVATIARERKRLRERPVVQAYPALVASEPNSDRPEQRVLLRGSVHAPGEVAPEVVPAAFRVPDPDITYEIAERSDDAASGGRRVAFARWLFDGGRHLSARVLANRIWQSHFGRGLCPSPGDFGRLGQLPTHPDLLDHLAAKVIEFDWSVKRLHRYLMKSRAYRMAGDSDDRSRAKDPTNETYWHFPPRRLTAEQYRDSVLAVSGELDLRQGGPSVFPKMQEAARQTASRPDHAWPTSAPGERNRRSLYVYTKRTLGFPLLQALDQPDPDIACPERFPTNVPTQSLMLLNGEFTGQQAQAFAQRLIEAESGEAERVVLAVRLALGRSPAADEIERHREFLRSMREDYGRDELQSLALFCLFLFNTNEFLWVD